MSRFQRPGIPLDSATDLLPLLVRAVRDMINNLADLFDKGVGIDDNLDVSSVTVTTNGTPDTEDAIAHTLGRIPVGYIVVSQNKAASVYASGTAWTKTTIYLKTSIATVALKLRVF